MGRPSVKKQRAAEILEAFGKCVCKYGIEGATLERIAEESGLARPLIRHHMGNREDLIDSLFAKFLLQANEMVVRIAEEVPEDRRVETLLKRLFDDWESDWELVLLAEAFVAYSGSNPEMGLAMGQWVNDFTNAVSKQFRKEFPAAEKKDLDAVATGVVGIFFNVNSLEPLGTIRKLRLFSKQAAARLIGTLAVDPANI